MKGRFRKGKKAYNSQFNSPNFSRLKRRYRIYLDTIELNRLRAKMVIKSVLTICLAAAQAEKITATNDDPVNKTIKLLGLGVDTASSISNIWTSAQ